MHDGMSAGADEVLNVSDLILWQLQPVKAIQPGLGILLILLSVRAYYQHILLCGHTHTIDLKLLPSPQLEILKVSSAAQQQPLLSVIAAQSN
jgi:hypothetical protein